MLLSELTENQRAKIAGVNIFGNMRRRLYDLGISPGNSVELVGRSILGNPRAYLVKGSLIALRNSEAEKIELD